MRVNEDRSGGGNDADGPFSTASKAGRLTPRTYAVGAAVVWLTTTVAAALAALVFAGVSCWLQGLIFGVAAVPIAAGMTKVMRLIWFGERAAYRRGVYLIIIGWAVVVHGAFAIRRHRAMILERERELQPVIEALERYHRQHDVYPGSLDSVADALPADHVSSLLYTPLTDARYHLSFSHNILVLHHYDQASQRWIDGV